LIVAEVIGTYTTLSIFLDSIVQMRIIITIGFFNTSSHMVCYSSGPIARILLNLALKAGLMKTVRDAAPTLSPKENPSTTFDNISKIDRIVTKFADIKLKGW